MTAATDPPELETPPPAPARPRLVIEWAGEGQADLELRPEGPISVAQLYAAAWLLDQWAREVRVGQVAMAGRSSLHAPSGGKLPRAGNLRAS